MYKLIAIDLDETLFCDDKSICQKNIDAIKKAVELDTKIVISSGRTPGMLNDLYDVLNIRKDNQYSILGNGAYIVSNTGNTVIYQDVLTRENANAVYAFGLEKNIGIQMFTPNNTYFFYCDEEENELSKILGRTFPKDDDEFFYNLEEPILKCIYLVRDQKLRQQYLEELTMRYPALSFSLSSNRYIEVNNKNINKGYGLEKLCEGLHIDLKDAIAIGDNTNDLEMIQTAGLGVAMANATENIKEISDWTTTLDYNHGGVGEMIEKYILGE